MELETLGLLLDYQGLRTSNVKDKEDLTEPAAGYYGEKISWRSITEKRYPSRRAGPPSLPYIKTVFSLPYRFPNAEREREKGKGAVGYGGLCKDIK